MSSSSASLVLRQLASDAPRAVHARLLDVSAPSGGYRLNTKVLHALPAVLTATAAYSHAHWQSLRVVVVPAAQCPAFGMILEIALLRDDSVVADESSILGASVVHYVAFGQVGSVPAPVTVPLDLELARLSSLVKPAPLEMRRAALGFRYCLLPLSGESTFSKDTTAATVYLSGVLATAGAS